MLSALVMLPISVATCLQWLLHSSWVLLLLVVLVLPLVVLVLPTSVVES